MAGDGSPDGWKAPPAAAAAAAAAAGGEADEVKMVEMPLSDIRWILAQEIRPPVFTLDNYPVTTDGVYPQKFLDYKRELMSSIRESLLVSQDEFSKYQAWVRETYHREGRVMIPADPPIDEVQEEVNRLSLQEEINLLFEQGKTEYQQDLLRLGLTTD